MARPNPHPSLRATISHREKGSFRTRAFEAEERSTVRPERSRVAAKSKGPGLAQSFDFAPPALRSARTVSVNPNGFGM